MRWTAAAVIGVIGWSGAAQAGAMDDCIKHIECLDYYDCEDPSECTSKCKPPKTDLWTKLDACGVKYSCSKVFDFPDYAACLQDKCEKEWELCNGPDDPITPVGCGDVSWEGECDGDTVLWCEDDEVQELDCGSDGQDCGWSDEGGFYDCLDPGGGCGDVTAEGDCDGDTVQWCEGGAVQTLDCASDGQECGWIDDLGFYDCVEAGGGGGSDVGGDGADAGGGGGEDTSGGPGGGTDGGGGTGDGGSTGGGGGLGRSDSQGGGSPDGAGGGGAPPPGAVTTTTTSTTTTGCQSGAAPLTGAAALLATALALLWRRRASR